MKYLVLILVLAGSITLGHAQSKKDKKRQKQQVQAQKELPSSRDPGTSDNLFRGERKMSKPFRYNNSNLEAKAVQEFQQRMKKNAKKYSKIERIKDKPRYSDPSYFGHKRKPKKRPVGKRKFCKECGIIH